MKDKLRSYITGSLPVLLIKSSDEYLEKQAIKSLEKVYSSQGYSIQHHRDVVNLNDVLEFVDLFSPGHLKVCWVSSDFSLDRETVSHLAELPYRLVLIYTTSSKSKPMKVLEKIYDRIECVPLKKYSMDTPSWIQKEFSKKGKFIDVEKAQLIQRHTGEDRGALSMRVKKILLQSDSPAISKEDLTATVTVSVETAFYEVSNFISTRDAKKALPWISRVYSTHVEDPSVGLYYAVVDHFQKLYIAMWMIDRKKDESTIAAALEMHPYPCSLYILPHVRKKSAQYTLDELTEVLHDLSQMEGSLYTGIEVRMYLESILLLHLPR